MEDAAKGPLQGLTVVDLSTGVASAFTTTLFADFGAEVVQIERPGGSVVRRLGTWPFLLRGKKSVVLDLHDAADREVAQRLARGADVVVEAFGPGKAERFGLGYEELAAAAPQLVYTSISGFGHHGPLRHLKGYEAVVMAKTGSIYGNIAPNRPGEPVLPRPFGATIGAALLAQQGTLLALHERERTGFGQRVDATMVQAMMAQDPWSYFLKVLTDRYPDAFTAAGAPTAAQRVPIGWLLYGLMNGYTKDGRWLQFAHATPKLFEAFMRALGLWDLLQQPEWKDVTESPDEAKRDAFWTKALEVIRSRTVAEWQEVFDREKDVFAEVYRGGAELLDHPQIVHGGHVVTVDDPELGPVRQMGPLVTMSRTPGTVGRAPRLDEHHAEVRAREVTPPASPAGDPPPPRPPLEGITIVDLGTFYAGPFASTMLADQGATVIKIEPQEGDPIRFQTSMPEATAVRVTQGKLSVAIDAYSPAGREVIIELIRRADLVLHSYRSGVAERMGLTAEEMLAINPNLVYHHGVGYGVDGPYSRRAALAPTIAAGSGWATRSNGGGPEGRELTLDEIKAASVNMGGVPAGHPDGMAALAVAVGMMLGLVARDRGAGGQVTLTSMLNTMGHVLADSMIDYPGAPEPPDTDPERYGFSPLYRLYRAGDGWIVLCAPEEGQWSALAKATGLEGDARFATADDRRRHADELAGALATAFAARSAREWETTLSELDLGCAEVEPFKGNLAMGLFEPGGIGERLGLLTTVTHPLFDEHVRSRELVTLSRGEARLGAGCTIGQHTDQVLRDVLGYDQARIDQLRADGVIA